MRFSTTLLLLFTLVRSWAAPHNHHGHTQQLTVRPFHLEQGVTPSLSVFPNPTRGQVTVQMTGQPGQEYKFRLANVLGREVRLLPLRPELATTGFAVDLTGLPTGLYFYSLLVNDKVVSTKRLTLQGD